MIEKKIENIYFNFQMIFIDCLFSLICLIKSDLNILNKIKFKFFFKFLININIKEKKLISLDELIFFSNIIIFLINIVKGKFWYRLKKKNDKTNFTVKSNVEEKLNDTRIDLVNLEEKINHGKKAKVEVI